MKKIALLLSFGAWGVVAGAQVSIPNANFVYTQDFNTLDTTATLGSSYLGVAIALPGWSISEKGSNSYANDMYKGSDGYNNTGDTYSYGTTQSTERALGSVSSNSNRPHFGVKFTNNSMDTITKLVISFQLEQWRIGDTFSTPDTTSFFYSTTANDLDTNLVGFTPFPGLDLLSLVASTTTGSIDGNASGNNAMIADSFTVNILPGNSIVLMWADSNILGSDDGLAIDDLSITFRGVGPTSVVNPQNTVMPLTLVGTASANNISLAYSIAEAGNYTLNVYDLTGRAVYTEAFTSATGMNRKNINANLQSGMYIIKLSNGKQTGIVKAMVQ